MSGAVLLLIAPLTGLLVVLVAAVQGSRSGDRATDARLSIHLIAIDRGAAGIEIVLENREACPVVASCTLQPVGSFAAAVAVDTVTTRWRSQQDLTGHLLLGAVDAGRLARWHLPASDEGHRERVVVNAGRARGRARVVTVVRIHPRPIAAPSTTTCGRGRTAFTAG